MHKLQAPLIVAAHSSLHSTSSEIIKFYSRWQPATSKLPLWPGCHGWAITEHWLSARFAVWGSHRHNTTVTVAPPGPGQTVIERPKAPVSSSPDTKRFQTSSQCLVSSSYVVLLRTSISPPITRNFSHSHGPQWTLQWHPATIYTNIAFNGYDTVTTCDSVASIRATLPQRGSVFRSTIYIIIITRDLRTIAISYNGLFSGRWPDPALRDVWEVIIESYLSYI